MTKKNTPKSTAAEDRAPGHHMGQRYGYDVLADGSIRIAPILTDQMLSIMEREEGLRVVLATVSEFVSRELARTSGEKRRWWGAVGEDLGIEIGSGGGWEFSAYAGSIRRVEQPAVAESK